VVKEAHGVILTDTEGRQYYDGLANAGTLALGHNHPVIVKAMKEYVESGLPQQALDLSTVAKAAFMRSLASVLPAELSVMHHAGPAGTDVLDAAIKLAKHATGRRHVVAFHGAYHGHGHGPLALMGSLGPKAPISGTMGDAHFFPYPYAFRNPFGLRGAEGEKAVMDYVETVLRDPESGLPKPAAVVVEAIQGEGGVNPMSADALRRLRRVTESLGIVLILDEVQAGMCRSGDFWAFQQSGIVPDIVCMSKALGGGMPMAVMAYRESLDKWPPGAHTGTFRGNQLAFVCGRASLEFMKDNRLWEQVRAKGDRLLKRLQAVKAAHPHVVADVRGRGLMLGVEFAHPPAATAPDAKDHVGNPAPFGDLAAEVQYQCLRRGLILERGGRFGAVVRFLNALTIHNDELDAMADIFQDAVAAAVKRKAT
jgi:diaminobutyrate-2-oxoglutarate transaminase